MPLLRITHTKDAFTDAQRDELAERLTHIMLIGETGADNAIARWLRNRRPNRASIRLQPPM